MSRDAYVRLDPTLQLYGPASEKEAILFIDLPEPDNIDRVRLLSATLLQCVARIIIRCTCTLDPTRLRQVFPGIDVARLHQPVGQGPSLLDLDGKSLDPERSTDLLQRARAVELEALLEFGRAVWQPTDYHFLLPSGRHGATFIKIGNALRGPRDAEVLASWLLRHFDADDIGFVIDSGTLAPVMLAVEAALHRVGRKPGRRVVLEHYPRTDVDVHRALRHSLGGASRKVVTLLSANSSGQLRDRVYAALTNAAVVDSWHLAVLVDQSGRFDLHDARMESWTPLQKTFGQEASVASATYDRNCALCRDPARAPLVLINPITFEQEYAAQLCRVMPDLKDPRENQLLWERCQASGALALEEAPETPHGPAGRMAIKIRLDRLIGDKEFRDESRRKLEAWYKNERERGFSCDLVLVTRREVKYPAFHEFWEVVGKPVLGLEPQVVPDEGEWDEALKETSKSATCILLFALGTVTGISLQRILGRIQASRRDRDYERLRALVVHARPARAREWTTLRNSFALHAESLWLSYLPDWSVLTREEELLDDLPATELTSEEREFLEPRRQFLQGAGSMPLFWGGREGDVLSPHSIYGDRLNAQTTLVAVGAAMQRTRETIKHPAPKRVVFELRAMMRSYYDPLIFVSMLRWLLPHEAHWGTDPEEAGRTLTELLSRAGPEQLRILVPELLLAAAQGKVPEPGWRAVVDGFLQKTGSSDPSHVSASLARRLLEKARPTTPKK